MISNYQKMKIFLYSGTETSILDLRVVHGLAGRWQRSGNVFPPSITEYRLTAVFFLHLLILNDISHPEPY